MVYSATGDYQQSYDAADANVAEAFDNWQTEVEEARRAAAVTPSLDATGYQPKWQASVSLRWILLHMIEEYARHVLQRWPETKCWRFSQAFWSSSVSECGARKRAR